MFSTTKGVTAVCANQLAQEGKLDVDAPVAEYWPEFAQGRQGGHSGAVPALAPGRPGLVDGAMTLEDALAWDPVVDALAAQAPMWEPGSQHGYHATTYGWLVGEVIRRVTGRSIGTYFRDEVAEPLGLDFWIGLPEAEEPRVATLVGGHRGPADDDLATTRRELIDAVHRPRHRPRQGARRAGRRARRHDVWNTRAVRPAEIPAANGVADARSIAARVRGVSARSTASAS